MLISKNREEFGDLLFAVGLILTTMTGLRMPNLPIGIGEILLFIWILTQWFQILLTGSVEFDRVYTKILLFGLLLCIMMGFGLLASAIEGRISLQDSIYDFLAYSFAFLLGITVLLKDRQDSVVNKIKYIVVVGTIVFTFLLIWWKTISPYFSGLGLVYEGVRFTGGAVNPNQLALFFVPIPALALFLLNYKRDFLKKIFLVLIFGASIFVALNTQSHALMATFILMLLFFPVLILYKRTQFSTKVLAAIIFLILLCLVILLNAEVIQNSYDSIINWFYKLDDDGSRAVLWTHGLKTALESPFVGYGPGTVIIFPPDFCVDAQNTIDAHNSFIDLFMQAGFLGLVLFIAFLKKSLVLKNNIYLTMAFFSLIIFSFSHFVLRQPIFWMYLIMMYSLNNSK
mgnify:CR=1 FL=1|jgi:O-antigen ligase